MEIGKKSNLEQGYVWAPYIPIILPLLYLDILLRIQLEKERLVRYLIQAQMLKMNSHQVNQLQVDTQQRL